MNGKLVLCIAVVFVAQTVTASVTDAENVGKIVDQFAQSGISITNHINQKLGLPIVATDIQKSYDKVKAFVIKEQPEWESKIAALKDTISKNIDPRIAEKFNDIEQEFHKETKDIKLFDSKKMAGSITYATKDIETSINKVIDGLKKP
ncbi:Hypothetical protein CINCED_3A000639 [Cinara cedri]|uniref:Uncharacterized protein n=1 Tax=Cinara cedri TaxID=506608 RepID=A0A5E4MF49_9HEMI|nr:Hypothetical protein CINCED_3A000639 [Cinara cedri]